MKIIEKIKKLLAMSEDRGATQSEAENAMELASALMMKYNISQASLQPTSTIGEHRIFITKKKELYKYRCVVAAAKLNACRSWWRPTSSDCTYCLCGDSHNIEAAKLMAMYLLSQVEKMYKIYLPKGMSVGDRAIYRRTFKYECANTLSHRAADIVEKFKKEGLPDQQCTALVVSDYFTNQLLEVQDWMSGNGMKIESKRSKRKSGGSGTLAGREAGNLIKINHSVGSVNKQLTR